MYGGDRHLLFLPLRLFAVVYSFNRLLAVFVFFFFFNDTATTEIYTLSLHDALPISAVPAIAGKQPAAGFSARASPGQAEVVERSEEHTSELQSRLHLVCRLLLEKKNRSITRPS